MSAGLHVPQRPAWICRGCQQPWPCEPARGRILAEFDGTPVSLALYVAGQFAAAAAELPHERAGDLYARIVGWIHDRR